MRVPNLKDTNRFGGTALIPAAHRGHVETVKLLLTTTIDKDHVNNLGWTALMEAVVLGDGGAAHTEIVRLLVAAGANAGIPDRDRITPLEHAKQRGYAEMVQILPARHANPVLAALRRSAKLGTSRNYSQAEEFMSRWALACIAAIVVAPVGQRGARSPSLSAAATWSTAS